MTYTETLAPTERLASVTGQRAVRIDQIRGYLPAVSSSDQVVSRSGAIVTYLTTAGAFEVLSSSANDTSAGTGARTIQVKGLDSNWAEFTEIVTMNGVTPVALATTTAFRINSAKVLTTGSGLKNAGNIDVRTVSGSTIYKSIPSATQSLGQDFDFIYTVPTGMIGVLTDIQLSSYGGTATADVLEAYIQKTTSTGILMTAWGAGYPVYKGTTNYATNNQAFNSAIVINAKETIDLRIFSSANQAAVIRAQGQIYLFKDGSLV